MDLNLPVPTFIQLFNPVIGALKTQSYNRHNACPNLSCDHTRTTPTQ